MLRGPIFVTISIIEYYMCLDFADIFIQLVGLHSGFRLHNQSHSDGPLKEPHLSGFCAANLTVCSDPEFTRSFLACPKVILSLKDYDLCMAGISINNFSLPKYSIFAAPTSIFEDSALAPPFLSMHEKTKSNPLFMLMLREPLSSIVSLWTHWNRISDGTFCSVPLSEILEAELKAFGSPGPSRILNDIVRILQSGSMALESLDQLVALRNELIVSFEAAMLKDTCQQNQTCMQCHCYAHGGFIFKSLTSLHILGWLRQFPPMRGNLLIISYSYYFKNRALFLLNRLMQFMYRDRKQFAADAGLLLSKKELENQLREVKATWHTPDRLDKMPSLSEGLKNRLKAFLAYADPNIQQLLFRLQQEKAAVIEPKIWRTTVTLQSKHSSWWFNAISNSTKISYFPPFSTAANTSLMSNE